LRDVLSLPYLDVKEFLPEDRESYGFNKVGDSLDVSPRADGAIPDRG